MTLGTHVAFASVLYLGGATLFGYKPDVLSWLLAAGFSLLPDIDLPPAKIGRLFWFVSVPLERRFGHRTLTHSALGIAALALLALPLWWVEPLYFRCVVGGYWSHLWGCKPKPPKIPWCDVSLTEDSKKFLVRSDRRQFLTASRSSRLLM